MISLFFLFLVSSINVGSTIIVVLLAYYVTSSRQLMTQKGEKCIGQQTKNWKNWLFGRSTAIQDTIYIVSFRPSPAYNSWSNPWLLEMISKTLVAGGRVQHTLLLLPTVQSDRARNPPSFGTSSYVWDDMDHSGIPTSPRFPHNLLRSKGFFCGPYQGKTMVNKPFIRP